MKTIKFQELSLKNNPVWTGLYLAVTIFILLSLFDVFSFMGTRTVKLTTAFCYLIFTLYYIQPFLHRNYVMWNKRGMTLRVNDFWGFNFSFSEVNRVFYAEDEYTLDLGGKRKTINLEGIDQGSKEKLLTILRKYTEGR